MIASICGIFVGVFEVFAASPASTGSVFDSDDPIKKLAMAAARGEGFVKKLLEPLGLSMGAVMVSMGAVMVSIFNEEVASVDRVALFYSEPEIKSVTFTPLGERLGPPVEKVDSLNKK